MSLSSDWLQYLASLPSGMVRDSSDLARVKLVASKKGLLDIDSQVVLVAGTNGKGSTVVCLESILLASGFKVGSYLSPHLLEYNERIRYNGVNIDDQSLDEALSAVRSISKGVGLSYFEFTTLAALVFFKRLPLDYLILEVGMGGRLDVVNILEPKLSIIATISMDHEEFLGNNRELIGYEKAGIIRAKGLVVTGRNMPSAVFSEITRLEAVSYSLARDFDYVLLSKFRLFNWLYKDKLVFRKMSVPYLPITSASLALMAVHLLLTKDMVNEKNIRLGLSNARLLGRMQEVIFKNRRIILDVAHNEESVAYLAARLANDYTYDRLLVVFHALRDKQIGSMVSKISHLVNKWYLGKLNVARQSDIKEVVGKIIADDPEAEIVKSADILSSLDRAIEESRETDMIVVFGSFYTVSEILSSILPDR